MTPKMKPKKIKPVRPVPVLAWTLCDSEGNIMPNLVGADVERLKQLPHWEWQPPRFTLIRVEIRPAPKRRKAARRKS